MYPNFPFSVPNHTLVVLSSMILAANMLTTEGEGATEVEVVKGVETASLSCWCLLNESGLYVCIYEEVKESLSVVNDVAPNRSVNVLVSMILLI